MTHQSEISKPGARSGAKFRSIARTLALLLIFTWTENGYTMTNNADSGAMNPGAFCISESGGLEYGSRQMSFDGEGKFYFAKGDTINDETQTGVGVFALSLQTSDIQKLKEVAQALCDKDIQTGGPETHDPAATFSTVCMDGSKPIVRSGSLRLIPENFRHLIFDAPLRLSEQARSEGRKLIKLDVKAVSVERSSEHYIVSVRFINSGNRLIKFKTPDQWDGTSLGGRLGVGAIDKINANGKAQEIRKSWAFRLGGNKLIDSEKFPNGVVSLNPGEAKLLKFETNPDYKAEKGVYEFSGVVFMRIEYEGYGWGLSSQVDFKPIKNRIAIDMDYPSTPQERERWEATHRATMLSQPVRPGETFAEDGLYRAVRTTSNAYRSLQLVPFKAGDVATTDNVKMLMASADGVELEGPVQWLWEGCAPTPVKPYSFDTIEETQQFCMPGAACPRSGRWLPRPRKSWDCIHFDLAGIVTIRRGQTMPPVKRAGDDADWEWVGA